MTSMTARMSIWARSAPVRLAVFSILWWALIEGDTSAVSYGLVVVPVAAAASMALHRPHPTGALRSPRRVLSVVSLLGWFLWRSVLGGVNVAKRAVSRPVDLAPEVVEYELELPDGLARLAVIDLASLMPGSLSAELHGDVLRMHVLHREIPAWDTVAELEKRVRRVIG